MGIRSWFINLICYLFNDLQILTNAMPNPISTTMPISATSSLLNCQNVTIQRGEFPLCEAVNLVLNRGDICHLVGENDKIGLPTKIDALRAMAAWLVKPKSGIAKNASRHTIPALVSQCTMSRTSTQVGSEARATTNCASVPLSRAGRNKFSIPIISDNNAAI